MVRIYYQRGSAMRDWGNHNDINARLKSLFIT
jgi:hypothetical protein